MKKLIYTILFFSAISQAQIINSYAFANEGGGSVNLLPPLNLTNWTQEVNVYLDSADTRYPNPIDGGVCATMDFYSASSIYFDITGIDNGSNYTVKFWGKRTTHGLGNSTVINWTTRNSASYGTGTNQTYTITSTWQEFTYTGQLITSGTTCRFAISAKDKDGTVIPLFSDQFAIYDIRVYQN